MTVRLASVGKVGIQKEQKRGNVSKIVIAIPFVVGVVITCRQRLFQDHANVKWFGAVNSDASSVLLTRKYIRANKLCNALWEQKVHRCPNRILEQTKK